MPTRYNGLASNGDASGCRVAAGFLASQLQMCCAALKGFDTNGMVFNGGSSNATRSDFFLSYFLHLHVLNGSST